MRDVDVVYRDSRHGLKKGTRANSGEIMIAMRQTLALQYAEEFPMVKEVLSEKNPDWEGMVACLSKEEDEAEFRKALKEHLDLDIPETINKDEDIPEWLREQYNEDPALCPEVVNREPFFDMGSNTYFYSFYTQQLDNQKDALDRLFRMDRQNRSFHSETILVTPINNAKQLARVLFYTQDEVVLHQFTGTTQQKDSRWVPSGETVTISTDILEKVWKVATPELDNPSVRRAVNEKLTPRENIEPKDKTKDAWKNIKDLSFVKIIKRDSTKLSGRVIAVDSKKWILCQKVDTKFEKTEVLVSDIESCVVDEEKNKRLGDNRAFHKEGDTYIPLSSPKPLVEYIPDMLTMSAVKSLSLHGEMSPNPGTETLLLGPTEMQADFVKENDEKEGQIYDILNAKDWTWKLNQEFIQCVGTPRLIRVVLPRKKGALKRNGKVRVTVLELHYLLNVTETEFHFFRIPDRVLKPSGGTPETLQYFLIRKNKRRRP